MSVVEGHLPLNAIPKCQSKAWSHRGIAPGTFARGHLAPCRNRAQYRIDYPSGGIEYVCGQHSIRLADGPGSRWTCLRSPSGWGAH